MEPWMGFYALNQAISVGQPPTVENHTDLLNVCTWRLIAECDMCYRFSYF